MTREIKFRYRFTDGKNWVMQAFSLWEIVNGDPFEVLSDSPLRKNYKLVGEDQFTGLRDKNGKEIYEGDVMKYENPIESGIGEIKWWNGCMVVWWIEQKTTSPSLFGPLLYFGCSDEWQYLGNIYESPELLEPRNAIVADTPQRSEE